MLSSNKWPHSLGIAVAACSTALVCALALSWVRHGAGEHRQEGTRGGGGKSRERGRSHATTDAVPAVLRPHDTKVEEEEEQEERARGGTADRKVADEGKKAVTVAEAKVQPSKAMSLEVSKQQRPLGMEPMGCLGGYFGNAPGGPAAGVWQSSPNFRGAARGQGPMSANEKRDLDNMFKHQGRQGGRAVYGFELARAKQARMRKNHRKGASVAPDVATPDSGVFGGATQDGDSELPLEQDLLRLDSLDSVSSATQSAPKKARKKKRRPARAAAAPHELEEGNHSGERQDKLVPEEDEEDGEESGTIVEGAAEVVEEEDDPPVDVQDGGPTLVPAIAGDGTSAPAEAGVGYVDNAEDQDGEAAIDGLSGGEATPLVDDCGGTQAGAPEGAQESRKPSAEGDGGEDSTSETAAAAADAEEDSNPANAPLRPNSIDVEAATSQEDNSNPAASPQGPSDGNMEVRPDVQRSSSLSSPPKTGGEDLPATTTCDVAAQTVGRFVPASDVEVSGRDTQRRPTSRSVDPEVASKLRRARAWADLTDTSDDDDEPRGCNLTPAVAAIIEKAVLPPAPPSAQGDRSGPLRSSRAAPSPSPPSPEAVDISSDQPGHDAVEPSQAAPEPEDTPEPTTLRKPGSCNGGREVATRSGPRSGIAGATSGKAVGPEQPQAAVSAAAKATKEAAGNARQARRAGGKGGAGGTTSKTKSAGADDGWETVLPKAKKKGSR